MNKVSIPTGACEHVPLYLYSQNALVQYMRKGKKTWDSDPGLLNSSQVLLLTELTLHVHM